MEIAEQLGLVNHGAETDVIVGMLDNEELALSLAQQVSDVEFYDPRRRILFAAIRKLLLGIEPLNTENVVAECRQVSTELYPKKNLAVTEEFVLSLKGNPAAAIRAAVTVHRLAWLRQAGNYAQWLVKALQLNPDPNELYTEAQSRWQILAPEGRCDGATLYGWETLEHMRASVRERQREAEEGLTRRFDWPWASWNQYVRPLRAGLVGVLAAPDGVGKSTFLEWIAEHWAKRNNKVVMVHLEDDHQYKLDRRMARHSSVPLGAIEDGSLTPQQVAAMTDAEHSMSEWADNLHYTHAPGWSMLDITKELQKLVDEGECNAVVLDYIDKCEPDRRQLQLYGNNQYLREGDNMNLLKNFAEKIGMPIFTATQGNKSMQDQGKVQTRQAIDGSGKKSQRAQLVMILTRDIVGAGGLWDGSTKIADEGDYSPIATLRIDKQNRGVTKTFHQVFRGECYRVGDLPIGFNVKDLNK